MSTLRATRNLLAASMLACALAACPAKKMTPQSVRAFVDAADQAFLKGDVRNICGMRSSSFVLTATEFKPARDRLVAGYEEAMQIAEQRKEAGELIKGEVVTLDSKKFCLMAAQAREFYKRATMQRDSLDIRIDSSGAKAIVRAHYTVKEPLYQYGDSPLNAKDQVEHQVASQQSESDDESIVALEEGELRFLSTTSVTYSFRVASERDARN